MDLCNFWQFYALKLTSKQSWSLFELETSYFSLLIRDEVYITQLTFRQIL